MAGNNKTWRLPVACAASVAMLATVGISAMTASAAPATVAPYNFTVTLDGGRVADKTISSVAADGKSDTVLSDGQLGTTDLWTISGLTEGDKDADGWVFTGWYTSPDNGAEKFNPDTFLNKDTTLYAHWAEPDNVITVNFNGGSEAGYNTVFVSKDEAKLAAWEIPGDTSGDSKLVTGWQTTGQATDVQVSDDQLTSDFSGVLNYANPGAYTVNLVPVTIPAASIHFEATQHGATLGTVDVAYNDTIDFPTAEAAYVPAKHRYVTEWADASDNKVADTMTVSSEDNNQTFHGTAWQTAYKVNFYTEINGKDRRFDSVLTDENTKVAAPTAPARNSGTFSMYTNPAHPDAAHTYDTVAFDSAIAKDTDLAAQWAVDSVTVTYDYNYAGKKDSKSYKAGDEFTVPTAERDGYVLMGWYTVQVSPAEFSYSKFTSAGETGIVLNNGKMLASMLANFKLPENAKLRITTNGELQYFDIDTEAGVDGNNQQTTTGVWRNIPNTLYAAWQLADNNQLNNLENRVTGLYDDNGNYAETSESFTDASWKQYVDDYQAYVAHKASLASSDSELSNAEAAELMAELQAAQAKLVQKAGADVYRMYNPYNHGDHLYTTSKAEYDGLLKLGWKGEGVKFHVTAPNKSTAAGFGQAVYRVYNPYNGEHLLTTDPSEVDSLVQLGWQADFDGKPMFYAPQGGDVQVTRLFNPYETVGTHLYTIDQDEVDSNVALGWVKDDVAFAAMK